MHGGGHDRPIARLANGYGWIGLIKSALCPGIARRQREQDEGKESGRPRTHKAENPGERCVCLLICYDANPAPRAAAARFFKKFESSWPEFLKQSCVGAELQKAACVAPR